MLSPVWLSVTPWTAAHQAPLSWSELPFPSPGDPLDPGIELRSPAWQVDASPSEPPGKPIFIWNSIFKIGYHEQVSLLYKNIAREKVCWTILWSCIIETTLMKITWLITGIIVKNYPHVIWGLFIPQEKCSLQPQSPVWFIWATALFLSYEHWAFMKLIMSSSAMTTRNLRVHWRLTRVFNDYTGLRSAHSLYSPYCWHHLVPHLYLPFIYAHIASFVLILSEWVKSCSVMSDSSGSHVACQALLSMEFSRQEYWSG